MKPAQFNAEIGRIHAARAKQVHLRNNIGALNGAPTYLRHMKAESLQKARFEEMGNATRKLEWLRHKMGRRDPFFGFGAISFDSTNDMQAYQTGVEAARNVDLTSVPSSLTWPTDALPLNDTSDLWSGEAENATDTDLYIKVIEKGGTIEDYKRRFIGKHGPRVPPFKESTGQLSLSEDALAVKYKEDLRQLAEITEALETLEKTLYAYNQQIAEVEAQLNGNTTAQDRETLRDFLYGTNNTPGLRGRAMQVREAITALRRQRGYLTSNMDSFLKEAGEPNWKGYARGAAIGGGGMAAGLALGVFLVWNARRRLPGNRRRSRDPIDIFSA